MSRLFPAEWDSHQATIVAWPRRREVWGELLGEAHREYASLVTQIVAYEDVLLVVHPQDWDQITQIAALSNVSVLMHAIDDGWIRDNGPIFCRQWPGRLVGVDFDFNSWGNRFSPSEGDRSVGAAICDFYSIPQAPIPWVMEGGAVSTNGQGALLLSSESVLHPSRNGPVSLHDAEKVIVSGLTVERFVWMPHGLLEDLKNTDGHVDNVAVFIDPRTVLMQTANKSNPNHTRLRKNVELVRSQFPQFEVVECDRLPYLRLPDGTDQPAPYLNFVLTNGSIILPSVGDANDSWATGFFRELFPDRNVHLTAAHAMTFGGGGPHCITMQVPQP